MNPKDAKELLNMIWDEAKRNLASLDEVYENFRAWNSAVLENIKLRRTGKKNLPSVPPTPGATLRSRRRLSPIGESPGDRPQSRARRTSKDAGRSLSSPKCLKRTRLSYDEEDEDEIVASGNTVEDSQNVCPAIVQEPNLLHVQENVCEVSEDRRRTRRGRRTKQSSILNTKLAVPGKRNTRSNTRMTRSITCEVLNDCDRDSLNVISLTSVSKPTQEKDVNEESTCQRGRRTKQSNNVKKIHRVTSTRISRSHARIAKSMNSRTSNGERNPQNSVTDSSNVKIVHEKNNMEERRMSKNGNEKNHGRRTGNSSIQVTVDISQDSLNVPHATSHSSISRSLEGNGPKIEGAKIVANSNVNDIITQNSNHRTLNNATQESLNICTDAETLAVEDNRNAVHSKRLSNNTEANKCITLPNMKNGMKTLSVCLTRIDGTWNKISSPKDSEDFLKVGEVQSGIERRKSEGVVRRSLNVTTNLEATKRSNSFVDNRPSKKSRCDKIVQDIEVEHVSENCKKTSNKPEDSGKRRSGRLASSKLSETNNKNHKERVEIESFSEISISPPKVENNNLFDELGKKHDKSQCDDKADSGKENSDNGLEQSEYYSLVDTCEITQDGKDTCHEPKVQSVSSNKARPKPSSGKKREETLRVIVEQNTPASESNVKFETKSSVGKKREETLRVIVEQNTPTPERKASRKGGKSPALFSAYANEPVKNRVAAYEGLSTVSEEVPVTNKRVTRTKTRAMAAAAAAAATAAAGPITGAAQTKAQVNNSHKKSRPSLNVVRASWRLKKKIANSSKKNDASKENSFQLNLSKNTDRYYKNVSGTGGKILADVNGLFSPVLNFSKKTPMTGPRTILVNNLSTTQISRSEYRPGIILTSEETFIKKPVMKAVQDSEIKKLEEQKKREEKEREAIRRREELLKKQAEEKKKKRDELRLRVQEKREAQEREKQESQLRIGKEKDEKWHIIQQERETKQKGNALKKKLESDRKAAEARKKLEKAEAARIAKLKMEELQHKKEREAEKEKLRHIAEENEAAMLRERDESNAKILAAMAKAKAENQKNMVFKHPAKVVKVLDTTFTKTLDSTFTVQSSSSKTSQNLDNAYNLQDIESGDSDDEDSLPKNTARWATKSALLQISILELRIARKAGQGFRAPEINISAIFPKKSFKRTSSAIWTTPPRYSVLPKY